MYLNGADSLINKMGSIFQQPTVVCVQLALQLGVAGIMNSRLQTPEVARTRTNESTQTQLNVIDFFSRHYSIGSFYMVYSVFRRSTCYISSLFLQERELRQGQRERPKTSKNGYAKRAAYPVLMSLSFFVVTNLPQISPESEFRQYSLIPRSSHQILNLT